MSDFDEGPNDGLDQRLGALRSVSGLPPTVAELHARRRQQQHRQRRLLALAGSGLAVLLVVAVALSVAFLRDAGERHDVGGHGPDTAGVVTTTAVPPPPSSPTTGGPPTSGSPTTATSPSTLPPTTSAGPRAVGPPDGPVPAGFVPVSVTFDSPDHGWVLGDAPCATPPCTSLLRTRDGGRTWHGIPAPAASVQTEGSTIAGGGARQVARVRFATDTDGWAFGTSLYATHDDGATWAPVALSGVSGDQVIALEASNGTAWALVAHCNANPNRCGSVSLYRSSVGSDAWQPVGEPLNAIVRPGETSGASALLVVHGENRWVVVGATVYGGPPEQPLQPLATPCGDPASEDAPFPGSIAVSDDSHLDLMCVSPFAATGHTTKQLMGSTDAGRHWTNSGGPTFSPSGQDGLADRGDGVLLSAESSVAAQIRRTSDNGASFSQVLSDKEGQGRTWADLGFTTRDQAVVVSVGWVLHLSRDAGATWSPMSFGS